MKTSLKIIAMALLLVGNNAFAQTQLTKDEKSKALDHLQSSQSELLKTVKGLSEEQLNYKPTPDYWSVAECVEHLAISETNIFGIVQMTLQSDPDPSMRGQVAMDDDGLLGIITSREQKVKTRPEFEPSGKFGSFKETLDEFKSKRKSNMNYVKTSTDDLRNRYFDFPFGKVDVYQVILFMSGHAIRHTDQIKEVMADSGFPNV
ncbi:MAG: DinB family protein [Bacteroidetes bacterium]|nr:DinB family protein [Bacteroidota bacterium]MDA1121199.1 DinB family protein [Bacteroidota bacterium]